MMASVIVRIILSYIDNPRRVENNRLVSKKFSLQGIEWWESVDFSRRYKCKIESADLRYIPTANTVQILSLSLKGRQDIRFDDFISFLIRCFRLKRLDLQGCPWVDGKVIEALPRRVHSLTIDSITGMSDRLFRDVKNLLHPHFNKVQQIELDGTRLKDEDFAFVAKCSNLRKCSVASCHMLTDNFLCVIKNVENLTCLRLKEGNQFTKDGLVSLFRPGFIVQLENLDFSDCKNFDDDCVFRMTQCCGRTLQTLNLAKCIEITDAGINFIIENCSELKVLYLSMLPKITWTHFMRIPEKMSKIEYLNLELCGGIDQDEIMEMVERKRDLQVVDYFGNLVKV